MAPINPNNLPEPNGFWNSLTTFLPNSNVYPIADGAVYGKMLQQQTGNIQILNNELAAQLFNFNYDTKKLDQKFHPNPSHPSNTTLGTAHADPRSWNERPGLTFENQGMSGYTKGNKSGVVEADRIAQEMRKTGQPQISNHNYNIINDPEAYRAQQQKMYEELFKNVPESRPNPNSSHPSNATLGSAHADPRSWKERPVLTFENQGMSGYTKGNKSGVVEADRIAQEMRKTGQPQISNHNYNIINDPEAYRAQQQKMYENLFKDVPAPGPQPGPKPGPKLSPKPGPIGFNWKNGKWAGIGLIAACAIAGLAYLFSNKNDKAEEKTETNDVVVPPVTDETHNNEQAPINQLPEVASTPEIVGGPDPMPEQTKPDKPMSPVKPTPPVTTSDNYYTVKKGDTCWGIAKKQLEKEYKEAGKDPKSVTNAEIRKRTEKIIENKENNLKWEDDNYTVIIKPGQRINAAA